MEAAIAIIIFLLILFFGFLAWGIVLAGDDDDDIYEWSHIKQKPDNICIPSCYDKGYEHSELCDDCWAKATCNCITSPVGPTDRADDF